MDTATEEKVQQEVDRQMGELYFDMDQGLNELTYQSLMMVNRFEQIQKEVAGTSHEVVVEQIKASVLHALARHYLRMREVMFSQVVAHVIRQKNGEDTPQNGQVQPSFFDQSFEQGGEA